MREENRVISIIIDWKVIKELIVDKIEGLPKDVRIIGIRHEGFMMFDTIGLYSKKFDKVPLGISPTPKELIITYKEDKINRRSIISKLEYYNK